MTALLAALGVLIGAVAAATHLALTRWRAGFVTGRRTLLAWMTYPLGLAVVGALLLASAELGGAAVLGFVSGLVSTRTLVLRRLRRSV